MDIAEIESTVDAMLAVQGQYEMAGGEEARALDAEMAALRKKLQTALAMPTYSDKYPAHSSESPAFREWASGMPQKHWAKYDIGACAIGWDAGAAWARTHVEAPQETGAGAALTTDATGPAAASAPSAIEPQRYFWTVRGMEKDDGEAMTQMYIEAPRPHERAMGDAMHVQQQIDEESDAVPSSPVATGATPRCDALFSSWLDSNDDRAWQSLARQLERENFELTVALGHPPAPVSHEAPKFRPEVQECLDAIDAAQPSAIEPPQWTEWKGGACPVPPETPVSVRFRDGTVHEQDLAEYWVWTHHGEGDDIVFYRSRAATDGSAAR